MGKKTKVAIGAVSVLLTVAFLATLFLTGIIKINTPDREQYPVWGVDVSAYQGKIDWGEMHRQGVQFALIKATEGSGYADPFFAQNWASIEETGILAGAYHFFRSDSPGKTQAENFIEPVCMHAGLLPPVVEIEFYGVPKLVHLQAEEVHAEPDYMFNMLTVFYICNPLISATR